MELIKARRKPSDFQKEILVKKESVFNRCQWIFFNFFPFNALTAFFSA